MSIRRASSRLFGSKKRKKVTEDSSSDEDDDDFVGRIGEDKTRSRSRRSSNRANNKISNRDESVPTGNEEGIRVKVEALEEFERGSVPTGNVTGTVKVETFEESSTINGSLISRKKDSRKATKVKSALELRTCPHPECGMTFDKPSLMKRHYQSKHAREPAAYCDVCGKGFFRVDSIPVHIRAHHPNARTNIKPKTKRITPKVERRDSESDPSPSPVSLDNLPVERQELRTELSKYTLQKASNSKSTKSASRETNGGSACKGKKWIKTPSAKRRDVPKDHHSDSSLSLDNFSDDEHAEKYEAKILKKITAAEDHDTPISLSKMSKNLIEEEGRNFWKPVVEQKSTIEDRTCPVCGKEFTKPSRMKRHFVVHRSLSLNEKYKPKRTRNV